MKSRSVSNLLDTLASFDFLPMSQETGIASGNEGSHRDDASAMASLADVPVTSTGGESASASEAGLTAAPFASLETQAEAGHPATNSPLTETAEASPGSGSINVIGTLLPEINAGLHIAPPVDSDFAATTDALFAAAPSAPAPVVAIGLADLTSMSFAGHGAEAVFAHGASPAALDTSSAAGALGAATAGLAFLEGSPAGSPIANAGVGGGGATAAQVLAALDESGLSVNGSGIKVGVLSDSFNDLGGAAADEASGALPSSVQVLADLASGGTDEGRAMLQIIHDIAPGASLAFYTAFNSEQDFANGILALANAGAKVIVDDVGYSDEPFFQNGVVAQAIQTVEAEGVTYVTAAGNDGSNGYQAAWTPISGTFDGHSLADAESFGGSLTQTITVNNEGTGDTIPLVLEWNQAFGAATSDLELLVFHNGTLVGTATNRTSGEPSNPWVEYDFAASGTYQVAIENLSGPNPGLIKEITWGDGLPATISGANAGTVIGHAMTPGAITAGAVSAADTPAFGFTPSSESFSSSGLGTELLFANNGTALSSPLLLNPVAVSGIDDIATTVPGGLSDFYGTSASSASLAGVAALILSADPNLTPAQVEQIMEQTALPMGNSAVAGAGLAQVNPAVAAALAMMTHTIQTDTNSLGTTVLTAVGNDYYLYNSGGVGPELKYMGAPATVGEFGAVTPVGAALTANGYEVAWQFTGTSNYTVWNTDSSGNYVSDTIGIVAGNSTTLESLETSFHQDINGDGVIGNPVIQTDTNSFGTTVLTQVVNNYYLYNASGVGPELKYMGAPAVVGEFGAVTPVGAALTSTGYEVAWQFTGTSSYTVWNTDSNGNYVSDTMGIVAGNSTTLESLEASFNQDLNGDGVIGIPVIQTDTNSLGTTSLTQVGNNYYLYNGSGVGPELKYMGAPATVGEFGAVTPIGAALTSTGYEVAWQFTGTNSYTVWNTDSNGNDVSDTIGIVAGNSTTLESLEASFNQDLNGDGVIGILVHTDANSVGTTNLTQVGNNYYLYSGSGVGPELKYSGAPVTAGEFGAVTPIGAALTSTGYEVAWQFTGTDSYTVWNTDSSGNYVSDTIGIVAGNSTTLESLETSFNQDLNGDGTIGAPPAIHEIASDSAAANPAANAIPDNFHFAREGSEMHQASAFFVHPNGQSTDTPNEASVMAAHNAFLFTLDSGASNAGNAGWPNGHAAPAGAHSDALSNDSTHAGAHGAQWLAHHDFHLI